MGVRRYRYMRDEGVKGLGGQTFAPLAYAINALVGKDPLPYYPVCVMSKEAFQKGKLSDSTYATAYSPWTVGYMAGQSAIKTLGKKKIFFLARSDSFGWDIRDGVYAAAKEYGAEIVGYDEVSLGTSDFTTVLQKVRAAKPDVFIAAQFAADAVATVKAATDVADDDLILDIGPDTTARLAATCWGAMPVLLESALREHLPDLIGARLQTAIMAALATALPAAAQSATRELTTQLAFEISNSLQQQLEYEVKRAVSEELTRL